MSEQEKPKSYMAELNQWIEDQVIDPLMNGDAPDDPNGRSHDVSSKNRRLSQFHDTNNTMEAGKPTAVPQARPNRP